MESILILNANTADTLIAGALLIGRDHTALLMGGKFQGEISKQTEAGGQNASCPQSWYMVDLLTPLLEIYFCMVDCV